jgi:hypothetical protein
MYAITTEDVAVTAAVDLFEILLPADLCLALHAIYITQSTEAGDAESEQLKMRVRRVTGSPTSGSGGSTPTPSPLTLGDSAASITVEANNTTKLTGGTSVLLHSQSFNVMAGLELIWTPEMRPIFSPSQRCLIELEGAPDDSITFDMAVYVEEIGG